MKNPGLAAVLSFFIPGLGQLYNGQFAKFFLFLVLTGISGLLTLILIGWLTGAIVWIWSMLDAYRYAENFNRRNRQML